MSSAVLSARVRTDRGKNAMKRIRAAGACPGVVYGPGSEPVAVQVDPRAFLKVLHASGENVLIDLSLTDEADAPVGTRTVIVREIQYDPLQPLPAHIDFYLVSLDRVIAVKVPLELSGVPEAVATKAATLSQHLHELHVECLPAQIPARITADVSGLKVGEAVHVRDLPIPQGVTVLDAADLTVATVAPIHAEVEAAAAPQLETAEPEVIRERKPAGEEA